jgi:hypothetical protein
MITYLYGAQTIRMQYRGLKSMHSLWGHGVEAAWHDGGPLLVREENSELGESLLESTGSMQNGVMVLASERGILPELNRQKWKGAIRRCGESLPVPALLI